MIRYKYPMFFSCTYTKTKNSDKVCHVDGVLCDVNIDAGIAYIIHVKNFIENKLKMEIFNLRIHSFNAIPIYIPIDDAECTANSKSFFDVG